MSDEAKAFDPTPQRLERARREGDVARAGEFCANLAFAAAAATSVAAIPAMGGLARAALTIASQGRVALAPAIALLGIAVLPVAAAAGAAVAGSFVQSGGVRAIAVTFKPARLDPVAGFKRTFSRETAAHALRSSLAFALAGLAMAPALATCVGSVVSGRSPLGVAAAAWQAAIGVAFVGCAVGGIFALAELAAARRAWLRRLRMSYEERKREIKDHDGDPALNGRRRGLHRALLRGTLARVKDAAFVVANPTHVAIALQYHPPEIAVPVVLVRAVDRVALAVRERAAAHRIPVVENVALARALLRDGRVDEPIPHAHYVAVAEIVAALTRGEANR